MTEDEKDKAETAWWYSVISAALLPPSERPARLPTDKDGNLVPVKVD